MNNINGILLIDKPKDWSSADVVRKVVSITHGAKVGQMGTLDPLATGVLVVAIGRATKLFDLFLSKDKRYIGSFTWGVSTNTQDITGQVEMSNDYVPSQNDIVDAIEQFIGKISQTPPAFSAKKVYGVPAYMLARRHQNVELKQNNVTIYDIKLLSHTKKQFTLDITCSSGTYIRTLGVDIARKCGACATMSELRRLRVGKFDIQQCHKLEEITNENIESKLISIDEALSFLPTFMVNKEQFFALQNGQIIPVDCQDGTFKIKLNDILLGVANVSMGKMKLDTYLYV